MWDPSWQDGTGSLPDQLAHELRHRIARGSISSGSLLPSERALAAQAGVSRTTVGLAIDLLEAGGWCTRRARSRAIVCLPDIHEQGLAPRPASNAAFDPFSALVAAPAALLEDAVERARSRLTPHLLGDGRLLGGLAELRAGIADRLTADGLATTREQVIITNGAMGALSAMLDATRGPVLVEDPTYHVALRLLASRSRRVVAWGRGPSWDVDALHGVLRREKPSVAYLIPDFHNPTGALAGNPERDGLAGLERRVPLIVIDETLRELDLRDGDRNLDRPAMPRHLAELLPDAVTIGGFSKIVWSGLRIGWVRAPQRAQRESLRRFTDVQPVPVFEQLIATELLPHLDEIVATRTGRLRVQRDALLAGLRGHGLQVVTPPGGLVAWVDLGAPVADELVARLAPHGVLAAPGREFGSAHRHARFLRVPFTSDVGVLAQATERITRELEVVRRRKA